ncbi:MAG: DUF4832 domain-containing protein [Lachnospiraceae bacterium]|nr:DUF4832 domain-containing protein [Lachnospiraceae bacterium]
MRLIDRLTGRHAGWDFNAAELKEYTGYIKNPARGWYQIHTFKIEDEPDINELEWCIDRNDTLAMTIIDIACCRDRDLSGAECERIRRILSFFAEHKYDVIFRPVYDHEGKALEREPVFFEQVRRHIGQLGEIIGEFENTVFICQGLLVGNWGEMHSSKFLSADCIARLAGTLIDKKGERTFLALRKPVQWRQLYGGAGWLERGTEDRMGLFDDGILGSESNLGTFGDRPEAEAGWNSAWSREEELSFEDKICRRVPNGGEAVFGNHYTDGISVENTLLTLGRMHVTYLNRLHDIKLINRWKQIKIQGNKAWRGRTLYDYIGARLGYRFLIRGVNIQTAGGYAGRMCRIDIEIENTGFARLYDEAELGLKWINYYGKHDTRLFAADMREWDSGRSYTVSCTIEVCETPLYIYARRKFDGAPIYFANASEKDGRVMLGDLFLTDEVKQ